MSDADCGSYFDDIEESDGDVEDNQLTEKGRKKYAKLLKQVQLFEDRNKVDQEMIEAVRKRLNDTYDEPEIKSQEKLVKVLKDFGKEESMDNDKFALYTLRIDLNKAKDQDMIKELLTFRV
eukprot:CAMPEP_0168335186 /NCGR_PEP_ID=MMETSP0213-20121227/10751_1 /TAXON_ID=151035 /ORGANISM="Euplotes harpa, Strain FSP1.4" /LENGTH=120 /DNA_ID=CAMNT_0008340049 /DNA_START=1 /DNA_END=360 /DNA_ORIENTATION=+